MYVLGNKQQMGRETLRQIIVANQPLATKIFILATVIANYSRVWTTLDSGHQKPTGSGSWVEPWKESRIARWFGELRVLYGALGSY